MRTVAALLFLTVCAYIGAGFYEGLTDKVQTVRAESLNFTESTQLYGIAVRREEQLCSSAAVSLPENGRRYAAEETLCLLESGNSLLSPAPGVFFEHTDGLEYLNPDMLFPFGAESFSSLMNAQSKKLRHSMGRLVFDNVWFFAARIKTGSAPENGQRCRLRFPDAELECFALVWDYVQAEGEEYVLLRINGGNEKLFSLRQCSAELILNEYCGISIPKEALCRDSHGNNYINVLNRGLVETRTVDIIYTGSDFCLAKQAYSWDALREGEMIVLQTELMDKG